MGNGVGGGPVGLRCNGKRPCPGLASLACAAGCAGWAIPGPSGERPSSGPLDLGGDPQSTQAQIGFASRTDPGLGRGRVRGHPAGQLPGRRIRRRVGLVRHNKYRIARVTADESGQVCRLTVAEGPLTPVAGFRSFADLRVGEPVVALASRTSAEVAAAPGWLAGKGAVTTRSSRRRRPCPPTTAVPSWSTGSAT